MTGYARRLCCLVVLALGLAASACGGPPTADVDSAPGSAAATSLLAFTATTLDGKPFDGRSLEGKPSVLWFWAPWCPICLQQAPGVRAAVAQYAGTVNIIGVAGLDKTEAMPQFVTWAKVEAMTHIADEPGVVWKRFGVTSQSIFVFVDADGQITFKGRLSSDEVPGRVGELVGA